MSWGIVQANLVAARWMVMLSPSHTGLATMLRPIYGRKIRRIADTSLTNRAIDLGSRGWSYEEIWSQQGWWSCSKLSTRDYKSQEVANRSYMIVRPVVQGRTINRAWSWTDKSRDWSGDWLGDHVIGRAICGIVSRLVVRSITIYDDWLHDLMLVVLLVICWWFHIKVARFLNNIRQECLKYLLKLLHLARFD